MRLVLSLNGLNLTRTFSNFVHGIRLVSEFRLGQQLGNELIRPDAVKFDRKVAIESNSAMAVPDLVDHLDMFQVQKPVFAVVSLDVRKLWGHWLNVVNMLQML